jgi:tetratricopeptide (TPR) repeat protein
MLAQIHRAHSTLAELAHDAVGAEGRSFAHDDKGSIRGVRWIVVLAVSLVVAATARADDWGARRDPFDPQIVHRYKAMLAKDPHDTRAFAPLVALYKQYRTVAKLEAEYRAQLGTGEDWATLVVLARLPRPSRADTLALWKRAVAAKPDDALGWLATGDAAGSDAAAARDAYRQAAKLATAPAAKRTALKKLVSAAQVAGDHETVDAAYGELIELSPKDGTVVLERGNAQLAAKHYTPALATFAAAEPLLRGDPESQLTAIMNEGIALDALAKPDEAIAQYERALDKVPSGYFLGAELVTRIVEVERRRGSFASAIARFEKRWPERKRGYFEWATLGDLYREGGDRNLAIAAYKHAVAIAPTEVGTQRKLITLLDQSSPPDALKQHEAAARVAPGDADLQIELAKRYHPAQDDKAFAVLDALARRMSRNINVRNTIANLYEQWNELDRAIVEYEALVAIEPTDPAHAVTLGDAYWRNSKEDKARAAWAKLDKIGTADALFRHGDVLAMHEQWDPAIEAYTKSLVLDGTNVEALYGRARAYDELKKFRDAVEDARRAVALTGYATHDDGLRTRQLLVRELGHAFAAGDRDGLQIAVAKWRFAFDRGDAAAGYLLAEHHARLGSFQRHDVLAKLYMLVPGDDTLGIALARSFVHRREFSRARDQLEQIAKRTPARAAEIAKLINQVDEDRERAEREIRWEEEGSTAPRTSADRPDLVGRPQRTGIRLEVGTDVREPSGALLGIGLYHMRHVADGVAVPIRFEWTRRDAQMGTEINTIAMSGGIAARILDARKFEVAVGVAPRLEIRFSNADIPWVALAGDATLEILPRALPATVGLRLDQNLTDDTKATGLFVELGFELR